MSWSPFEWKTERSWSWDDYNYSMSFKSLLKYRHATSSIHINSNGIGRDIKRIEVSVTLVCCRGIFVYTTSSPITLFLFGSRTPGFTKFVDVWNVVNWRKFDRYQHHNQPLTPLCFVFSTLHIYVTWQRVFQVVATKFKIRTGGRFGHNKYCIQKWHSTSLDSRI